MKAKFLKFISNPKYIFGIYLLTSIITALSKMGEGQHNNYLIFKNVFYNTLHRQNLYGLYPELYFDSNHYGIFFSWLIMPFALLPDVLGMPLWNLANAGLLIYAFSKLPLSTPKKSFVAWLCFQEYITAAVSLQFNVGLTALLILSAIYINNKKEVHAAVAILIGFFVKIYGIAGLSGFFFIKNKMKFIFSIIGISILFFVMPMLISDVHFGWHSYVDWYQSLSEKNLSNQVLGNRQDYSLMGIVRRVLGDANISNLIFLIPGMLVFALPYIRISQYQHTAFRMMILASTLLFIVLFSSGSESPTYIIAVAGVMIWFIMQKQQTPLTLGLMIFVMVLTCFGFSDLFPRWIKEEYIIKYSLKALPCCLVWFRIIYELMVKDFEKDYALN
ncbi:glycosyltransferase family 87 protein [Riemerella columbina]|uniref:glycosyltransferase family 87 protein n=1 Tax=Riemerella columbina TaxID=103810 RepID=UPI0003A06045|nr:glycosyltransferase family 87 protein [Riemerella columbina]